MIKIRRARHVGDYKLELEFSTDETGTIDLRPLVTREGEMVAPLRDVAFFSAFFLELGALTWANGFDLSPSALHREMRDAGLLHAGHAA